MLDMLVFMAAPFAACLILVGVHGYLGLHVLLRQVIFVDLALAQIAAFGAVVAWCGGTRRGLLPRSPTRWGRPCWVHSCSA